LKNKHFQTIFSTLFRKVPPIDYIIENFSLSDGDFLEVYWSKIPNHNETTPIIILFHGLAGSFASPYIQGATQSFNSEGYSVVVMHFRGCAVKENLLARSYHSGESGDAKEFIQHLHKLFPSSKLYAVGYSLGANMLLKLLGEEQKNSLLTKAVAISAPMQLDICADFINKGFSKYYQSILVKALNKNLERKYNTHNFESLINLKRSDVSNLRTFWDFDGAYTAPIHGFISAQDYYTQSSAKQFLQYIHTPTLIIHALDDPFMSAKILPTEKEVSKNVTLEVSKYGGHLGFISGNILKPVYWTEKRIIEFFKT